MFETFFPVIVPRSYFQLGNWPGPFLYLRHPDLAVTWVELTSPNAMLYVNHERQQEIERSGFDVHATAMANLRRQSRPLATHEKTVGDRIVFGAMMHADGLGTSRLLLLPELDRVLPEGYWLAIPERSCGVVAPKSISPAEREEVLLMVSKCFQEGTIPMLPGLHESNMFEIADDQPADR
jgi:hypothetical protein